MKTRSLIYVREYIECRYDYGSSLSQRPNTLKPSFSLLRTGMKFLKTNRTVARLSHFLSDEDMWYPTRVNCPSRVVQLSRIGTQKSTRLPMTLVLHLRLLRLVYTSTSNITQITGTRTLRIVGILPRRSPTRALMVRRRRTGTMIWPLASFAEKEEDRTVKNHVEQLSNGSLPRHRHLPRCHLHCQFFCESFPTQHAPYRTFQPFPHSLSSSVFPFLLPPILIKPTTIISPPPRTSA